MQKNCIKELRKIKDLSRAELSRITGIGAQSIAGWENGHHVPIKYIPALAKAFGLPEEEVVWEEASDHREIDYVDDPSSMETGPDVRPQIACYCGNCRFWKRRNGQMYRCTCKNAEMFGQNIGGNYLCTSWYKDGLSFSDVLSIIPDDGALWKNLMAARILKGISIDQVSAELGISESTWKQYEKGLKAMPLEQLAKFAELCDISPDRLVKGFDD